MVDVDLALAVPRIATGVFFAISGAHKLFVPSRTFSLVKTLIHNKVPAVSFNYVWVPAWELAAGVMLTVGAFSGFAAGVLAIIMLVACWCEARGKVEAYRPINAADRLDDYLYLPEVLYLVMLAVTMLGGPGAYSLDAILHL